jgi:biotin operon repressor
MAKHLPSDVWRCGSLDGIQKLVLLAILDYGRVAYPRQAVLAAKCGISRSTCQRALDQLRASGVLTTSSRGKALVYQVNLTGEYRHQDDASTGIKMMQGSELVQGTNQPNPGAAEAAKGVVVSAWDGIDPEDRRRILRHPHGGEDIEAKHRVVLRELAKLGVRESEFPRWWRQLGKRWGDTGVEPYSTIAAELEEIGADVRDRAAVLAFRLGVGRAAA